MHSTTDGLRSGVLVWRLCSISADHVRASDLPTCPATRARSDRPWQLGQALEQQQWLHQRSKTAASVSVEQVRNTSRPTLLHRGLCSSSPYSPLLVFCCSTSRDLAAISLYALRSIA